MGHTREADLALEPPQATWPYRHLDFILLPSRSATNFVVNICYSNSEKLKSLAQKDFHECETLGN